MRWRAGHMSMVHNGRCACIERLKTATQNTPKDILGCIVNMMVIAYRGRKNMLEEQKRPGDKPLGIYSTKV